MGILKPRDRKRKTKDDEKIVAGCELRGKTKDEGRRRTEGAAPRLEGAAPRLPWALFIILRHRFRCNNYCIHYPN